MWLSIWGTNQVPCPSASILAGRTVPKQGAAHDGACKVVSGQSEIAEYFRCITDQEPGHSLTVSVCIYPWWGRGGEESLSLVTGPRLSLSHLAGYTGNFGSRSRDPYGRR